MEGADGIDSYTGTVKLSEFIKTSGRVEFNKNYNSKGSPQYTESYDYHIDKNTNEIRYSGKKITDIENRDTAGRAVKSKVVHYAMNYLGTGSPDNYNTNYEYIIKEVEMINNLGFNGRGVPDNSISEYFTVKAGEDGLDAENHLNFDEL